MLKVNSFGTGNNSYFNFKRHEKKQKEPYSKNLTNNFPASSTSNFLIGTLGVAALITLVGCSRPSDREEGVNTKQGTGGSISGRYINERVILPDNSSVGRDVIKNRPVRMSVPDAKKGGYFLPPQDGTVVKRHDNPYNSQKNGEINTKIAKEIDNTKISNNYGGEKFDGEKSEPKPIKSFVFEINGHRHEIRVPQNIELIDYDNESVEEQKLNDKKSDETVIDNNEGVSEIEESVGDNEIGSTRGTSSDEIENLEATEGIDKNTPIALNENITLNDIKAISHMPPTPDDLWADANGSGVSVERSEDGSILSLTSIDNPSRKVYGNNIEEVVDETGEIVGYKITPTGVNFKKLNGEGGCIPDKSGIKAFLDTDCYLKYMEDKNGKRMYFPKGTFFTLPEGYKGTEMLPYFNISFPIYLDINGVTSLLKGFNNVEYTSGMMYDDGNFIDEACTDNGDVFYNAIRYKAGDIIHHSAQNGNYVGEIAPYDCIVQYDCEKSLISGDTTCNGKIQNIRAFGNDGKLYTIRESFVTNDGQIRYVNYKLGTNEVDNVTDEIGNILINSAKFNLVRGGNNSQNKIYRVNSMLLGQDAFIKMEIDEYGNISKSGIVDASGNAYIAGYAEDAISKIYDNISKVTEKNLDNVRKVFKDSKAQEAGERVKKDVVNMAKDLKKLVDKKIEKIEQDNPTSLAYFKKFVIKYKNIDYNVEWMKANNENYITIESSIDNIRFTFDWGKLTNAIYNVENTEDSLINVILKNNNGEESTTVICGNGGLNPNDKTKGYVYSLRLEYGTNKFDGDWFHIYVKNASRLFEYLEGDSSHLDMSVPIYPRSNEVAGHYSKVGNIISTRQAIVDNHIFGVVAGDKGLKSLHYYNYALRDYAYESAKDSLHKTVIMNRWDSNYPKTLVMEKNLHPLDNSIYTGKIRAYLFPNASELVNDCLKRHGETMGIIDNFDNYFSMNLNEGQPEMMYGRNESIDIDGKYGWKILLDVMDPNSLLRPRSPHVIPKTQEELWGDMPKDLIYEGK